MPFINHSFCLQSDHILDNVFWCDGFRTWKKFVEKLIHHSHKYGNFWLNKLSLSLSSCIATRENKSSVQDQFIINCKITQWFSKIWKSDIQYIICTSSLNRFSQVSMFLHLCCHLEYFQLSSLPSFLPIFCLYTLYFRLVAIIFMYVDRHKPHTSHLWILLIKTEYITFKELGILPNRKVYILKICHVPTAQTLSSSSCTLFCIICTWSALSFPYNFSHMNPVACCRILSTTIMWSLLIVHCLRII